MYRHARTPLSGRLSAILPDYILHVNSTSENIGTRHHAPVSAISSFSVISLLFHVGNYKTNHHVMSKRAKLPVSDFVKPSFLLIGVNFDNFSLHVIITKVGMPATTFYQFMISRPKADSSYNL